MGFILSLGIICIQSHQRRIRRRPEGQAAHESLPRPRGQHPGDGIRIDGRAMSVAELETRLIEISEFENPRVVLLTDPITAYRDFISALDDVRTFIEEESLDVEALVVGNRSTPQPDQVESVRQRQ